MDSDPMLHAAAEPPAGPLHGCVRCGTPIPVHESMCERCNPLGLKSPAASQAHATVFVGIIAAVIVMAVVAKMALSSIGPFASSVDNVAAAPGGLRVTLTLANQGSSAGSITCRIDDPTAGGVSPSAVFIESPQVPAGGSITFDVLVGGLGTAPRPLLAACGS